MDELIGDIIQGAADVYDRHGRVIHMTLFPRQVNVWFQEHHFEMISTLFHPIYQMLRQSEFRFLLLLFLDRCIPPAWDDYSRVLPCTFHFRILCRKIECICALS